MNATKIEQWTSKLLVFLAVGSFILSFAGMYAVAVDSGYGWLAWLWPLVTESAVVIFSLVLLSAKLDGYKNNALQPMIITCTVLSVGFNVLHAPNDKLLTKAVVALPPIFLYAAFKTWIWKVEQDTRRVGMVKTLADLRQNIDDVNSELQEQVAELDKVTHQRDILSQQLETLKAERETLERDKTGSNLGNVSEMNQAKQQKIDERREQVLHLLGQNVSKRETAEQLGVSKQTISRDIQALNGRVS